MLRRHSEQLKLFISGARGVDESLATKRERIGLIGEAQTFEFEGGDHGHEDVLALGVHGSCGGLGQVALDFRDW